MIDRVDVISNMNSMIKEKVATIKRVPFMSDENTMAHLEIETMAASISAINIVTAINEYVNGMMREKSEICPSPFQAGVDYERGMVIEGIKKIMGGKQYYE